MLNIILADDHKVVRQGLRALLSTEPDFNVVGEAENGLEALEMVAMLKPDVLVLDLTMPTLGGLQVIRALSRQAVSPRIVILSMHSCAAYVNESMRSGARAYVLKDSSPEDLITAIRQVSKGSRFVSSALLFELEDEATCNEDLSQPGQSNSATEPENKLRMASKSAQSKNCRKIGKKKAFGTYSQKQLYA